MIPIPAAAVASNVTKHITGYALIVMAVCIVTLFGMLNNLNGYIRTDLTKSNIELNAVVDKNNTVLQEIKNLFQINKEVQEHDARERGREAATKLVDTIK